MLTCVCVCVCEWCPATDRHPVQSVYVLVSYNFDQVKLVAEDKETKVWMSKQHNTRFEKYLH